MDSSSTELINVVYDPRLLWADDDRFQVLRTEMAYDGRLVTTHPVLLTR